MTGMLIGYLRESNDDEASPDGQKLDIVRLAGQYGFAPDDVEFINDFGYSGRNLKRPGYTRMKDEVAAGRVAVVFARSVDRLGRDAREFDQFEALCFTHGTRVITDRDGERAADPDSVNTLVRWLPALLAEEESRLGRDRAKRARQTRTRNLTSHQSACQKGDHCSDSLHWDGVQPYGTIPGEDLQAVLSAFRDAGSYSGAVRLLEARGVAPRRGMHWESTSVSRIVKRAPKDTLPKLPKYRRHQGSRTVSTHTFAMLLRCPHDGTTLTATNRSDRKGPSVGYFCRLGRSAVVRCPKHGEPLVRSIDWTWKCPTGHTLDRYAVTSDHPRPWSVGEPVITEWATAATANVGPERLTVTTAQEADDAASLEVAQSKRVRLGRVYVDGLIPEAQYREDLAVLDADIARLTANVRQSSTYRLPVVWNGSRTAADLNASLRDMWVAVILGPDMRPTGAVWTRRPVLRFDDDGDPVWDPEAVERDGGWYLPTPVVTSREGAVSTAAIAT